MSNIQNKHKGWQHWLRFSAFTLAGVAFEGGAVAQSVAKPKKWPASGQ
ncbi:hypothetical protein [Pantoea sp. A4]|nr:hypothetical protein [Pantoea sp. A4]